MSNQIGEQAMGAVNGKLRESHPGMNAVRVIVRYSAWLAVAYLGYWTALFLQSVFVQGVIYPILGSPLEEWRLTAFRAFLANGSPETLPFPYQARELMVMLAQASLVVFVLRLPTGTNRALLRAWSLQAALWTVLLRGVDSAVLAFLGRGSLTALLPVAVSSRTGQVTAALVFALILLTIGGAVAGRLIAVSAAFAGRQTISPWRGVALIVLPVCLFVAGYLGFQFQPLGIRAWLFLSVPSAFSLALTLLGLLRTKRVAFDAPVASLISSLRTKAALVSILLGALVYGGLANAQRVERWSYARGLQTYVTRHYEIRYNSQAFRPEFVRQFSEERERTFAALASRLLEADPSLTQDSVDQARICIILYEDFPRKRLATRSDRPYTVEGGTLHVLMYGYIQTLDPAADAAALLHEAWGAASSLVIRGWVARFLAGDWRGETVEAVAARLHWEEGHYPLKRLLDMRRDSFLSPLVREQLGAAWITSLRVGRGVEAVRNLYSYAPESASLGDVSRLLSAQPTRIENDWALWMSNLAASQPHISLPARAPEPDFFYRGMSFSHEGWGRRRGGYAGSEAQQQLEFLRGVGVNAIAVIPFGFQNSVASTTIASLGADETDEELTQALFVAHGLGQKVMLKPQLWIGGGTFSGEIRFSDATERAQWFRSYRALILHYARLAEQEGFDLLCIANELGGMSPHEDEWRALIAEIRRVYRGPITYAANWGEEFESVSFWDALDYIGLNHYYPLRAADDSAAVRTVQVSDLVSGAEKVARVVETISQKYARPVIFTEIGYPSFRGGTAEPWAEDRRRSGALEEQAAAYEACFRVYANKPWLRGMFWWKWNSNGRGGGEQDRSFTPMRKPAAEVLHAWYERLANGVRADKPAAP